MHKVGRTSRRGSGGELMAQTITIKNAGRQPLGGPLALRVGGLPSGVTLANATGTYQGGSYRDVLAADQPLAPGKSVTVTLDFSVSGLVPRASASLTKIWRPCQASDGPRRSRWWFPRIHQAVPAGRTIGVRTIGPGQTWMVAHPGLPGQFILNSSARRRTAASGRGEQPAGCP